MVDDIEHKATHTTPDSLTINYFLNEMIEIGCEFCFMEVSSHGIHQKEPKVYILLVAFLQIYLTTI